MNFGDGFTLICQLNKNIWYSGVTESSCCGASYTLDAGSPKNVDNDGFISCTSMKM